MFNWRVLTPVYEPALSGAHLMAQGRLFAIGLAHFTPMVHAIPHLHDCYELGYVYSGNGFIVMGQQEYPYVPGQVYIINNLEPHTGYTNDEYSRLVVVHFHPTILNDGWIGQMCSEARLPFSPDFNTLGPLLPLSESVTEPVRRILDLIYQEADRAGHSWEIIVGGLIIQAVGLLARRLLEQAAYKTPDRQQRKALKRIKPILELVENRFADPLSLDDMANAAHVSRSHCCALFQDALGTTPIAYRNARRLTEARLLLQNSDLSVKEIAYQVGFSSVQEFNRLFRRETNSTPSEYRARFQFPTSEN